MIGPKAEEVLNRAVRYAFDQLTSVHARVLGCVLNDVDSKRDNYYGPELAGKYYEAHT